MYDTLSLFRQFPHFFYLSRISASSLLFVHNKYCIATMFDLDLTIGRIQRRVRISSLEFICFEIEP